MEMPKAATLHKESIIFHIGSRSIHDFNITSARAVDREFVYIVGCPFCALGLPLGVLWGPFGATWAALGRLLGPFGIPSVLLGGSVGHFKSAWCALGALLAKLDIWASEGHPTAGNGPQVPRLRTKSSRSEFSTGSRFARLARVA